MIPKHTHVYSICAKAREETSGGKKIVVCPNKNHPVLCSYDTAGLALPVSGLLWL